VNRELERETGMGSRRTFLKAGAGAAIALALGGGIYRATRASLDTPLQQRFALGGEARNALGAIVPALLAGALANSTGAMAPVTCIIERVHRTILGLPLAAQREIQDLFGLLALAPARRVLTGISGGWSNATPAAVHEFLQDWRASPLGLLRAAYAALHDLVLAAWYADPASWDAIGYPGPTLRAAP
jgi:hypothetical protein